jgi:ketosteroid isomerase-like protein
VTSDGVAIARELLDRLEAGVIARDASALDELCARRVVLFGTAGANVGSEEVSRYLRLVVESNSIIHWLLDRWSVVHNDGERLLVAASGQVEFDDGNGPERSDFRLSLWLVREADDWKIGHFHGSIPAA